MTFPLETPGGDVFHKSIKCIFIIAAKTSGWTLFTTKLNKTFIKVNSHNHFSCSVFLGFQPFLEKKPPPPTTTTTTLLLNLLHIYYGGETYSEITLSGLSLTCKIYASEPKNVSEISWSKNRLTASYLHSWFSVSKIGPRK